MKTENDMYSLQSRIKALSEEEKKIAQSITEIFENNKLTVLQAKVILGVVYDFTETNALVKVRPQNTEKYSEPDKQMIECPCKLDIDKVIDTLVCKIEKELKEVKPCAKE